MKESDIFPLSVFQFVYGFQTYHGYCKVQNDNLALKLGEVVCFIISDIFNVIIECEIELMRKMTDTFEM